MLRGYLYEVAVALLSRHRSSSALQTWAQQLVRPVGDQTACAALARKLAVRHASQGTSRKLAVTKPAMGLGGTDFQPEPAATAR